MTSFVAMATMTSLVVLALCLGFGAGTGTESTPIDNHRDSVNETIDNLQGAENETIEGHKVRFYKPLNGDPFNVPCQAKHTKLPYWTNKHGLIVKGANLTVPKITERYNGFWYCYNYLLILEDVIRIEVQNGARYNSTEGEKFGVRCDVPPLHGLGTYWSGADHFYREGPYLSFAPTKRSQAGWYYCWNRQGDLVETIYLNVQYPAKILNVSRDPAPLHENTTYSLTVTVEGNPTPTTSFIREYGEKIASKECGAGEITLTTSPVECEDGGMYKLVTQNAVGQDSKDEELQVYCAPSPRSGLVTEFKPRLGESVALQVKNVGFPYPTYTWTFNGKELAHHTGSNQDEYDIDGVVIDDYGTYTLTMENEFGEASVDYEVKADGPPEPVTNITVTNVTDDGAVISFTSGFDYNDFQTFTLELCKSKKYEEKETFEDQVRCHGPHLVTHEITGLKSDTTYKFSILSKNSRGESPISKASVEFTTTVRVYKPLNGDPLNVPCRAKDIKFAQWRNQHGTLIIKGANLTVSKISKKYDGYWYCYNYGLVLEDVIKIEVQNGARYNSTEGSKFVERCDAQAFHGFGTYWTGANHFYRKGPYLVFTPTKRSETGWYYCWSLRNELVETIYLNVQYPAKILNVSRDPAPLHENSTFSMTVTVEGNPTPTTSFIEENGGKIISKKCGAGEITITTNPVECGDSGMYKLMTQNAVGSDSKDEELQVYCAPSPKSGLDTEFKPRLGENVTFQVQNIGFPYPAYTWTYNGKVLAHHKGPNQDEYDICGVVIDDYGTYTVTMENEFGAASVDYEVKADGPPEPVTDITVTDITQNGAVISFTSGFDYNDFQTFILESYTCKKYEEKDSFEDKARRHEPHLVTHEITGLKLDTTYNFSILAKNSRGKGAMSKANVVFTTKDGDRYNSTEGDIFIVRCKTSSIFAFWTGDHHFYKRGPSLDFTPTKRSQSGWYYCWRKHGDLVEKIYLNVQYPAKILKVSRDPAPLHENTTFSMTVTVEGNPAPTTSFIENYNGKIVSKESGAGEITLTTGPVECVDGGMYKLISNNVIGNDSRDEELQVYCAPSPNSGLATVLKPRLGETVALQVQNVGFPYPTYTWSFNGMVLANHTGPNQDEYDIDGVVIDDYGTYTLTMENEFGATTVDYEVKADGPPDPVSDITVTNITENGAVITFTSGFDYDSFQTFIIESYNGDTYEETEIFEDNVRRHVPHLVTHEITKLELGTTYNFSILANNSRGDSPISEAYVVFTTEAPYTLYEIVEGDSLHLECNGTDFTDVHWEFDNGSSVSTGEEFDVDNITRQDSGYYKCVGRAADNLLHILEDYHVDVEYPARILNVTLTNNHFNVNESLIMEVEVEGHPTPTITLTKVRHGEVLFTASQEGHVDITVDPLVCTDLGQYVLNVSNKLASDTFEQTIFVYCPPVVDPQGTIKKRVFPRLGNNEVLTIMNYGYPYPTYSWKRNDQPLDKHEDSDYESRVDMNVTVEDFGNYFVDMQNEYGLADYTFEVIASGPPDPITNFTFVNKTSDTVTLSWVSGFNYGNNQTFVVMATRNVPDNLLAATETTNFTFLDQSERGMELGYYELTGLEPATTYNFTVVSFNSNGTSALPNTSVDDVSTPDAPEPEAQTSKSEKNAIIGGVIGAVCFVGILVIVGVFLKKRREQRTSYEEIGE